MNSRPAKPVIKAKSDVMTFGKYKGRTVRWILDNDPSYIRWLADKDIAKVSQNIYDLAEDEDFNNAQDWWMGEDPTDWMDD